MRSKLALTQRRQEVAFTGLPASQRPGQVFAARGRDLLSDNP